MAASSSSSEEAAEAQLLSAYEIAREERIAQNKAKLAALGLGPSAGGPIGWQGKDVTKSVKPAKAARRRPREKKPPAKPSRQSKRVRREKPENGGLSMDADDENTMLAYGGDDYGDGDDEAEGGGGGGGLSEEVRKRLEEECSLQRGLHGRR